MGYPLKSEIFREMGQSLELKIWRVKNGGVICLVLWESYINAVARLFPKALSGAGAGLWFVGEVPGFFDMDQARCPLNNGEWADIYCWRKWATERTRIVLDALSF